MTMMSPVSSPSKYSAYL